MLRTWLAVVCCTLVLVAQSPPSPAPTPPVAAGPQALGDTGLRMELPAGYMLRDGKSFGLRCLLVGPDHRGFAANANLTAGPARMPSPLDAEALRSDYVAAMQQVAADYRCLGHGTRTLLGTTTFWISGTFRKGELELRNLQVMVPTEPVLWFTFTTLATAYAEESPAVLAALATMTVDPQRPPTPPAPVVRRLGKRLCAVAEGFALVPPPNWEETDPAPALGAFLLLAGPAVDGLAPNLNVRTEAGAKAFAVAEQERAAREVLPKLLDRVEVEEVVACQVAGRTAVRVRASHVVSGGAVVMVQYLIPAEPRSFVATFTVAKAKLATALPQIEACAASFELGVVVKDPPPARPAPKSGK